MSTAQPAPMKPDRRLQVFLCHATGDKQFVRELYGRLRADGFAPWLDEKEILPGQRWQEEIPAAVRASDVVIVCLSQKSVSKEGYLQREIRYALDEAEEKPEGTIFIIPARIEEVDVPKRLSEWQWANLFSNDGYERLVSALNRRAQTLGLAQSSAPDRKRENPAKLKYASKEAVDEQQFKGHEARRSGTDLETTVVRDTRLSHTASVVDRTGQTSTIESLTPIKPDQGVSDLQDKKWLYIFYALLFVLLTLIIFAVASADR